MTTNRFSPVADDDLPVPEDALPRPARVPKSLCPPTSPFHTQRGKAALDRVMAQLPEDALAAMIQRYKAADPDYPFGPLEWINAAKHTTCCAAMAASLADFGLRVVDTHSMYDSGRSTGRSCKLARAKGWQIRAERNPEKVTRFYIPEKGDTYPPTADGIEYPVAWIRAPRGVGIATGDGIVVLDEDGPGGRASLARLQERNGKLPETAMQKTGRLDGGRQYFLRVTPDVAVPNSAGRMGEGLDARGQGGFAMCGPSIHPTLNFYEWLLTPMEVGIAIAPDWLIALMLAASKKSTGRGSDKVAKSAAVPAWVREMHTAAMAERAETDWPSGIEGKLSLLGDGEGKRGFNDVLFQAALSWFAREGIKADKGELLGLLRAAIKAAPKGPGRDVSRYFGGPEDDLHRQINRAHDYAVENF
ncbi:bifunctional DNA primase/polymerase [Rubellimicrobium arenae]|uniref:bifunctional DNA primase/polymerase n=1 Tax=Rubellimicrobium arenae TaxID=2817372 RepID=UPI001B30DB75|nr:bifunctional DNA primase/polymerase [Rubellimicrobium arenae]